MKRFLSFALFGCLCLFANVARAAAVGDIIYDDNGVAYSITSLSPAEVSVCAQYDATNKVSVGVTTGDVVIPSSFTYDGTEYSVTATAAGSFNNTSITSLVFSDGITEIPGTWVSSCSTLAYLTLPSTLTSIGSNSIRNLTLTSLTCYAATPPTTVTTSFRGTTIGTLYVPAESVSAYESSWSSFCTNIVAISSDDSGGDDETGTHEVGDIIYDDNGVAYEVTSETTVSVAKQCAYDGIFKSGNSVDIPETVKGYTVTAVSENAFYDTTYQGNGGIDAITLPTTITTIGDNAFNMCTNITTIDIPEGVTTIGAGVLSGCTALTTISLPSTLTSVGTKAFSGCKAVTNMTCLATTAPTLPTVTMASQSPFNSINQTITLWVPCGSTDSYSTWVSMMSSYSAGGSFTVSELECTGNEGGDEGNDDSSIPAISIDGTTTITGSGVIICSVTLDSAGTLSITEFDQLYTDEACTEANAISPDSQGYSNGSYMYNYTLEAGTYYGKTYATDIIASFEASSDEGNGEDSTGGTTTSDGIEITPAAGTVTSISSIRFAHDPIAVSWEYNESNVQIVNASGEVVAQGYTDGYDEEYSGSNPDTAITFYLNNEVTEDGTYTLKVPAEFFYLDEAGSTYSAAIEVEYTIGEGSTTEEAAITLVSPESEDGVIYAASWPDDTQVIFTSSVNQGEVDWKITDVTDGVDEADAILYSSYASYNSSTGQYVSEIYEFGNGITFYENHTYELTGYVKSGATTLVEEMLIVTIYGTTPESENPVSTVTLVSSDPECEKDIELASGEALTVVLTFSDPVNITVGISQGEYGSNSLNATGVEGTGSGDYYTQWTFSISYYALEDDENGGEISVMVSGTDENGKKLFDESGYVLLTYYYVLTGDVDADLCAYTFDPEDGATVSELSTITVGNENGIAVSYLGTITITNEDGDTVESLTGDDCEDNYESEEEPDDNSGSTGDDTGWSDSYSVTITLSEAITTAGTYTVNIPNGFFVIGEETENTNSPAITLTYTVSGSGEGEGEGEGEEGGDATGISAIQAAIANGAEVYTISGQKVNAPVSGVNVVKYADGTVKKILQK